MHPFIAPVRPLLSHLANARILAVTGMCLMGACTEPVERFNGKQLVASSESDGSALTIYWSGAASVVIDDGADSLLIDPFVSRAENGSLRILFRRSARLAREDGGKGALMAEARSNRPEYARAKAIFVSHSHYDHVLDVPDFARFTGAPVFASKDADRVLEGHGVQSREVVSPGDKKSITPFHITVLRGKHAKPPFCFGPLGCIDPLEDHVQVGFEPPEAVNNYGKGDVLAFVVEHEYGTVLHIGTAGGAGETIASLNSAFENGPPKVDVVLLSLVGRAQAAKYLDVIIDGLKPRYVIPIHYDYIFDPLEDGVTVVRQADLAGFFQDMEERHEGIATGLLGFDQPWRLPPE